jgi:hypothetical protein
MRPCTLPYIKTGHWIMSRNIIFLLRFYLGSGISNSKISLKTYYSVSIFEEFVLKYAL